RLDRLGELVAQRLQAVRQLLLDLASLLALPGRARGRGQLAAKLLQLARDAPRVARAAGLRAALGRRLSPLVHDVLPRSSPSPRDRSPRRDARVARRRTHRRQPCTQTRCRGFPVVEDRRSKIEDRGTWYGGLIVRLGTGRRIFDLGSSIFDLRP